MKIWYRFTDHETNWSLQSVCRIIQDVSDGSNRKMRHLWLIYGLNDLLMFGFFSVPSPLQIFSSAFSCHPGMFHPTVDARLHQMFLRRRWCSSEPSPFVRQKNVTERADHQDTSAPSSGADPGSAGPPPRCVFSPLGWRRDRTQEWSVRRWR